MMTILKAILAFFLPPLGAALQVGPTKHFWINLVLTLIFYVPGLIHAWWLIFSGYQPPAGTPGSVPQAQ